MSPNSAGESDMDDKKEEIEIQEGEHEDKPWGPALTPEQKRQAGLRRMRELMKASKVRGNPKDFVLTSGNQYVADWERGVMVKATLPPKLDPGDHVWSHDRNNRLRVVNVVSDEGGESLVVANGVSQFTVARTEVFPTGLPIRPTLLHKSQLRELVGESAASLFWNHRLKMRVNQR